MGWGDGDVNLPLPRVTQAAFEEQEIGRHEKSGVDFRWCILSVCLPICIRSGRVVLDAVSSACAGPSRHSRGMGILADQLGGCGPGDHIGGAFRLVDCAQGAKIEGGGLNR